MQQRKNDAAYENEAGRTGVVVQQSAAAVFRGARVGYQASRLAEPLATSPNLND